MNKTRVSGMAYHKMTAHKRNRLDGAVLDWANQPDVFKHYPDAPHIPLVPMDTASGQCLRELVSQNDDETPRCNNDLAALSDVLVLGNGITFERVHGGAPYTFRSAASAGALYPVELYVDARHVKGLAPGLYHVDIRRASLAGLRTRGSAYSAGPCAVIYLTGMFFRSAWKYRKRAYRYILNDLGHVAANIILGARSRGFRPDISFDFHDNEINGYLGLDTSKEACLARIRLWDRSESLAEQGGEPFWKDGTPDIPWEALPIAAREIVYPEISDIHQSGTVIKMASRGEPHFKGMLNRVSRWEAISDCSCQLGTRSLGDAIRQRRSRRNFVGQPMDEGQAWALIGLVASAWRMIGARLKHFPGLLTGFLFGGSSFLDPGYYLIDPLNNRIGLVEEGVLAPSMASACLDQMWLKSAGFQFLMISDLKTVDEAWGPRGYRYVMMNAGILGQIIYLGSTALGLGCCGIGAFYDDEASVILDLQSHEHLLYLLAAGPVRSGCFLA